MIRSNDKKLRGMNSAQLVLMLILTGVFFVGMVFPLSGLFIKAFQNDSGDFAGLNNYIKYFSQPALSCSVFNTLDISLVTAMVSTTLGFVYAYALQRTNIGLKRFFRYAALFPIFVPTVVQGIGLIVLFGKQGILTQMGFAFELYGRTGIILSEIIYTFPQAFLMFYITLHYADGRLYEAADSMGCNALTKFLKITSQEIKYTLINSLFVCFTLAFTDFGAPKVVGGSYNVLATDLYKQVAGQFNFNMGAVVSTLMLIPALLTFAADRMLNEKNYGEISAKAIELKIKTNRIRDGIFFTVCLLVCGFFIIMIGALAMDALMKYYPYERSLTFQHFLFSQSTGGIQSFVNSIVMSLLTALFGTAFVFIYTYLIEKGKGMKRIKKIAKLLSVAPIALPGMVIGLSFIFFFNAKSNPLNFIYGTIVILVLSNIIHFYSVPYVTAAGALKKLDKEFESIAESMKIPLWKIFLKVSVPMSLPAVLEIFMYYFVNSMVTVSAVVFLYSAGFKVASIAITHMEEAGDIAQASAMSLLILAVNLLVRSMYELYLHQNKKQRKKNEEVARNDGN
jgi:putative 2-aminoethylphosphonate ABC transporter, permease protein